MDGEAIAANLEHWHPSQIDLDSNLSLIVRPWVGVFNFSGPSHFPYL